MIWHPYAKLFPMLGDEAIEALAEDIRQNGQRTPIVVDGQERIIDGRNRSAACFLAGIEPELKVFKGDDREILKLVVSLNVHRRHLDESQRANIAAKLLAESKLIDETNTAIAVSVPVTQEQAAEMMNVSTDSLQRASAVLKTGIDELKQDVDAGKVKVSVAAGVAKLSPAEQKKAVESGYPKPVKTWDVMDDINRFRKLFDVLSDNWKTEADLAAMRKFFRLLGSEV